MTLGPLTNIARALDRDPSLPDRIPRTVVMGAVADHIGNVTPVAEFNMWADPHAAQAVLESAGQPPNAFVVTKADRARFIEMLRAAVTA